MRQKRAKTYRKLMSLYCLHFGFRQPYQVLVDSEMCKEAISSHLDLPKQLATVLQGNIKPIWRTQQPAVDLAKSFERRKCNHREAIPGDECLISVVGDTNKHRYVIATQSQPLRSKLRKIAGIPLIHINRSVVVLEPPSDATLEKKENEEEQALLVPETEKAKLPAAAPAEPPKKKRKGPKGPNPLSVKKKKTAGETGAPPAKRSHPSNSDPTKDTVGSKRKQEEADDHRDEPGTADGSSGHKRKRRRKHKQKDGNGGNEGDEEENND